MMALIALSLQSATWPEHPLVCNMYLIWIEQPDMFTAPSAHWAEHLQHTGGAPKGAGFAVPPDLSRDDSAHYDVLLKG
jgi:hypothetical protein